MRPVYNNNIIIRRGYYYYFVVAAPHRSRARASRNPSAAVWYGLCTHARGPCDYHYGGDGRDSVIESLRAAAAAANTKRGTRGEKIKLPILYAARGVRRSLVTRALNDIGRVL